MDTTIYTFLATGFEEIEAFAVIDICRRAGINVKTVSLVGEPEVVSVHGIKVIADTVFEECDFSDASMLFLPGGMPGASNLNDHEGLRKVIMNHYEEDKPLAAICAAPMVFGTLGILEDVKATCYPGFDKFLTGAEHTGNLIEEDGLFITGKGPGAAFALGYAIVEKFCGKETADALREGMIYNEMAK